MFVLKATDVIALYPKRSLVNYFQNISLLCALLKLLTHAHTGQARFKSASNKPLALSLSLSFPSTFKSPWPASSLDKTFSHLGEVVAFIQSPRWFSKVSWSLPSSFWSSRFFHTRLNHRQRDLRPLIRYKFKLYLK